MVALRSRRLESMMAAPLDALRADNIHALVRSGVQEAFDLDYKVKMYGRSDSDRRALAGDVAALANTAGGVILIGVDEDDQARATAAPGVEVTDSDVARIRQVVAALVSPLPAFDVLTILDTDDGSVHGAEEDVPIVEGDARVHGFVLIAVPRSPSAPHAVLVNDALRYPKRNGATTRYLSEPEVAAAYRDRIAGVTRQTERIVQAEQEGTERLDRSEGPWLVVSLVPELPGDLLITNSVARDFQRNIVDTPACILQTGLSFRRASVGRRRLLADGNTDSSAHARWASAELHTDGTGVYGSRLVDLNAGRFRELGMEGPNHHMVDDELIAVVVLSGLVRLAQHARDRAAASGNVIGRARLLPATSAESIGIGHTRAFGVPDSRSRVAVGGQTAPAETSVALDDLAQPGSALVSVAAMLIDDLGQEFGIPEMGQLSRNGEVRQRYWGRSFKQQIVEWAGQHGITVTEEALT